MLAAPIEKDEEQPEVLRGGTESPDSLFASPAPPTDRVRSFLSARTRPRTSSVSSESRVASMARATLGNCPSPLEVLARGMTRPARQCWTSPWKRHQRGGNYSVEGSKAVLTREPWAAMHKIHKISGAGRDLHACNDPLIPPPHTLAVTNLSPLTRLEEQTGPTRTFIVHE